MKSSLKIALFQLSAILKFDFQKRKQSHFSEEILNMLKQGTQDQASSGPITLHFGSFPSIPYVISGRDTPIGPTPNTKSTCFV